MEKPVPGQLAPDFQLMGHDGKLYSLADFAGKKLVLYFYPKDNTSACTKEAIDFNDSLEEIARAGGLVVGISRDTVKSHQRFVDKHNLKFLLLADSDEIVCQAYGVLKEKIMFGKTVMGIVRSTFIIDEAGKLLKTYEKVKVDGHVADILAFLRSK